jgi:hypothetical protein
MSRDRLMTGPVGLSAGLRYTTVTLSFSYPRTPADVFVTQTFLSDNFDIFLYISLREKPCYPCLPCISTVWSYSVQGCPLWHDTCYPDRHAGTHTYDLHRGE